MSEAGVGEQQPPATERPLILPPHSFSMPLPQERKPFNIDLFDRQIEELRAGAQNRADSIKFQVVGDTMFVFTGQTQTRFYRGLQESGVEDRPVCAGFVTSRDFASRRIRWIAGYSASLERDGFLTKADSERKKRELEPLLSPRFRFDYEPL